MLYYFEISASKKVSSILLNFPLQLYKVDFIVPEVKADTYFDQDPTVCSCQDNNVILLFKTLLPLENVHIS